MKTAKPIKIFFRLMTVPFVVALYVIAMLHQCVQLTIGYVLHGGEFITYRENENILIKDIYQELKDKHTQSKD